MRVPSLLAGPSAYADIGRRRARVFLAGFALLIVVVAVAMVGGPNVASVIPASYVLDSGTIEGVRHGGDYYGVASAITRGDDAVARPLVGARLPTLAVVAATVPPRVFAAMLAALALAVALAWYERLAPALAGRGARLAAAVLILAGLAAAFAPSAALSHEVWAGLFLAIALARWRPTSAAEAIGWGLAAALVDERAAMLLIVMAAFAWAGDRRREAASWLAALTLLAATIAAHLHAQHAAGLVFGDTAREAVGPAAALAAMADATALRLLPPAIAATTAALALAGWSAWRDPLAPRLVATLLGLLALAAFAPASGDAAALAAPLLLVGLLFLPDALRDLGRAALDRRRIIVRRVAR